MDITGVSMATALANVDTKGDIGVAVLSKAMDTNEAMGDGIVRMLDKAGMERSVNPAVGGNVDEYV